MIKFKKSFQSYEGEGPKIGLKTLFLTYDKNEGEEFNWNAFHRGFYKPIAVYLNTECFDQRIIDEVWSWKDRFNTFTYEISFENYIANPLEEPLDFPGSFFFRVEANDIFSIDCNKLLELSKKTHCTFKIEATKEDLSKKVEIANFIAGLGRNISVALMPLYSEGVGEDMMYYYPLIHSEVRIMPPTQFLIKIK
jgi:hypothetical protein